MKKIMSIALALILVFSLAACGSDKGSGETKGTEPKTTEATKAPETDAPETEASSDTKAPETETTEAPETDETAQSGETAGESEAELKAIGTWDGSTYTSTELGLSFTMPEGWTKVTDVKSMGSTTTQEFMLIDAATGESFILMTEDLAASGIDSMSEADYLAVLKEQLTQSAGYTIEENLAEVDVADDTYTVLAATAEQNNDVTQQLYLAHKIEGKMYIFIITAKEDSSAGVDAIMDSVVAAK